MLEVLFNGMAETAVGVEKMNGGGAHGSKAILDYVYKGPNGAWRQCGYRRCNFWALVCQNGTKS